MTGEQFVKLCYEEKKTILAEYFNPNSSSVVGKKISAITEQGISKDDLYDLLNLVLKENYYTLLLGLDGEASLGNTQMTYKLYDENGNLLNECGELETDGFLCMPYLIHQLLYFVYILLRNVSGAVYPLCNLV